MNPNSNLERELLGNLNTTSGADAEYQRISNMLLSGLNLTNPQPNQANVRVMQNPNQHLNQTVRPVPIQSNVNITTGGAKPVGIPIVSGQPNTVKVNPSPVRIMTTGNPGSMPVTISTNNSSALPSTFKFTNTGAPVTIPNTGPNVITSNMTAQRPITTTSIPTTITQPQQPTQQQQQANKEATNLKMTNFKLFLEKQAAVFIHDQKSLQQWNETVSQFFNNKGGVSLGKLFEILSVIVGKEKKEAILQQAIREGYVSLPKPPGTTTGTGVPATAAGTVPQSNAGQVGASSATPLVAASGISVGIPYQTHLESLLRQIQTPQRERIIDHLKKLPSESQRNATIMQLVENFNRQKAAAQQGQPNSIKPPSLPSQITDLDKRRILTPVAGKITDTLQSRLLLKEDIVEDLKDVTRIAGIDVDQENAEFLRDNDNIEAFEEDRSPTMIQLNVLKRRMAEIAGRQGLKVITDETIYYLAYSIESLLRDMTQVINKGIPITRMDLHKKSYVDKILQNNKKRAKFIQKVEKEEDNRLKKRRVGDDSKVTESSPRLRESGSSGSPSLRSSSQGTTNILSQINPLSNLTSGSSTSSSVSSSSQAVPSSAQAVPSGVQAAAPVPPQVKSPALSQSVPSSNQAATVPSVPVPATNQTPMSSMGPIGFNLHSMPSNSSSNGTPTNNRSSTILSFDDE